MTSITRERLSAFDEAGAGGLIWPRAATDRGSASSAVGRDSPAVKLLVARAACSVCCLLAYAIGLCIPVISRRRRRPAHPCHRDRPCPAEDLRGVRANWTNPRSRSSPFRFTEIAREAGIDFVHVSGMTEAKHFPTANGSGVAIFDYDNDGKLDLYFATATLLPVGTARTGPNRLYRNLGDNRFQDVTEASGLGFAGFCHGIVVGDIDNDGDPDVFLCNYGPNVLFLNNGDGTFEDISQIGRDRPARLVHGRGLPRLRQRRRPRPLRGQLRRLEAPRRRSVLRATRA